jgi:hypothetical protein
MLRLNYSLCATMSPKIEEVLLIEDIVGGLQRGGGICIEPQFPVAH